MFQSTPPRADLGGDFLPEEPSKEDLSQREYLTAHGRPLLLDYATEELRDRSRIVVEGEHWFAVVPYWALWPYETLLLPKTKHVARLTSLPESHVADLAETMRRLLIRYDNLFECSFPYSMGWHGAPFLPEQERIPGPIGSFMPISTHPFCARHR